MPENSELFTTVLGHGRDETFTDEVGALKDGNISSLRGSVSPRSRRRVGEIGIVSPQLAHGRWAGGMMAPRFKGKPNFDLSVPSPLCGYKIQPNEQMRLASHIVKCPKCGGVFDELGGRKPISTS